jgi:hypothetical protein
MILSPVEGIQSLDLPVVQEANVPFAPAQPKRPPELTRVLPQAGRVDGVFALLVEDQ